MASPAAKMTPSTECRKTAEDMSGRGLLLVDAIGDLDEDRVATGSRQVVSQLQEGPFEVEHGNPVGGREADVGEIEHVWAPASSITQ